MKIIMNRTFFLAFYCFLLFIISSCLDENLEKEPQKEVNPFEHISDSKVIDILTKAFEKAGGLERWNNLEKIHFEKHFALFDSTGAVEMEVKQQHDYYFKPKNEIKISWKDKEGSLNEIISKDNAIVKKINGKVDESANAESLKNTILSSTFVAGIPFKLLDEGPQLSYDGIDTLRSGKTVHVLKAVYNPENHDNHSTPDIWWHYFDENDYRQLGYMVQHIDHFSYIENLTFTKANDFPLTETRKSYRVDSLKNILYLRAEYDYSGYDLK